MPEQSEVQHGDLRIVHRPAPPNAVLAGLPPVYAHGLGAVLRADGVGCTVLPDLASLAGRLAGGSPLVVVVPWASVPGVLPDVLDAARAAVVALLETASVSACEQALNAGVTGVLTPDDAPDDVVLVVRAAAQGRTVLPRELLRLLCRPSSAAPPVLSPVELGWLRRLAAGGTVSGLARACGYSEREMYRRLSTLYLRLGARTRTEALLLAERSGLLDTRR